MAASSRLLRLLSLLQSRRHWPGGELAERLEVTPRTVRRDVDRLRQLGYPVRSDGGPGGGYELAAGSALPPLLLDEDEFLAVAVGLRQAAAGPVGGSGEATLRALAKLEQVIPARLRSRLRGLHDALQPVAPVGPQVPHDRLMALATACRDLHRLSFDYRDRSGRQQRREVEPHAVVCTEARWYLLAWDLGRRDWRTFRVDRIVSGPEPGPRFLPRRIPGGKAADYVARSVAVEMYRLKARVLLHASRTELADLVPAFAGRLQEWGGGRCLLETGANRPEYLAAHLAVLGVDFEVLEPPELATAVRDMAARLRRAARRSQASTGSL
ncbi:helix-turn-helix transcriptional regulator [Arenimonas fontis]|uniref:YafY family transcriptional regulator n=1 Tax=Arenimonas fontis TaxID=2608255 RepID=A0A5B2ZAL7_9GAMM|nr:YafY family protein [Arenimonas fontis]KAA2285728.1 YafY family transcriptional regulator [Arenimonas fontis]